MSALPPIHSMHTPLALSLTAVLGLALTHTAEAHATDYYIEGTLSGGASTWEDDPDIAGTLHTGFEFLDIVSVDLLGRLGYAAVDERMLMLLGIGTKLAIPIEPFTPFLRVTALHQHETPVDAMGHDTFGHIMGVGDGIRHRFGVEGALGATVTFAKTKKADFAAEAEGFVDAFPDERGPMVYGGASLGLAIQVGL